MVDVPVLVQNKARSVGATAWLAALPGMLAELEREWSMTIGRAYDSGTEAFVARAILRDATPVVVKLIIPRSGAAAQHEITVLRLAGGEGCTRLLRSDVDRGALLLERLGRPLCDRIAAHDDERAVLVHGDVHQWNALEAGGGFALIDPDGLLAEPEYDLGVLMREDPVELLAEREPFDRAARLAAWTGLDASAIWEWGVVERVSAGLICAAIELQPVGRQLLAAADRVAAAWHHLGRVNDG